MSTALHYLIAARQCEIDELHRLQRTSTLVRQLGELIHALQKERGLSNILLASHGQRARQALHTQVQASTHSARALRDVLDSLDLQALRGSHGARLCNHIAYVLQGLDALPALRARIAALDLSPDAATQAYIRLIAGLLAVVFEAADSATHPDISRLLIAMLHFMQGKELAGQERATGATVFSSGTSTATRQQHWLHLIDSQERCLQVFAECAPATPLALWQAACMHSPHLTTIERLRRIGCTSPADAPLDMELGEIWFDACTLRMDTMHEIETTLADELLQRCHTQLQAAQAALAHPQSMLHSACDAAGALPDFFSTSNTSLVLRPGTDYAPQLGQSVMALVQEQSLRLQAMHHELETVRTALTERKTVERAKGLLMTHRGMSEAEAHKLLRQTAMNQNRRLIDVAEAMLAMADLLPLPGHAG